MNADFFNALDLLEKEKGIPQEYMFEKVEAALLTAYKNAGGELDLEKALTEMQNRGKQVPGGICGFWGSCGAAVSTGIFLSIITGSTPLSQEIGRAHV